MIADLLSPRRSYGVLLSGLFVVVLALPLAWLGASAIGTWRGGVGAVAGAASIDGLRNIERRFEVAFPFRKPFWRVHNKLRHALFRAHPASVVSGQNGWWFYRSEAAEDGPSLNDRAGRALPSLAEVEQWRSVLERRRAWLAAQNIVYVPVIAPNKHTIYPDQLPIGLQRETGETRLDRVMAALGPWPTGLLDLRASLSAARSRGDVYLRTDTHWNDDGAYIAYAAIVEAIRTRLPAVRVLPRECFAETPMTYTGDIVSMIQLAIAESTIRLQPDPQACAEIREVVRRDGPTILLFGDSFAARLVPFLEQSARSLVTVERIYGQADVLAVRPAVVIHELAERHLDVVFDEAPPDRLRLSR